MRRKLSVTLSALLHRFPLQHFIAISGVVIFMLAKRRLEKAGSQKILLAHPLTLSSWPVLASERDASYSPGEMWNQEKERLMIVTYIREAVIFNSLTLQIS